MSLSGRIIQLLELYTLENIQTGLAVFTKKRRFHVSDKAKRPPCYLVWLCERVGLEHWVTLFESDFIACTESTENSDVVAPQPNIHCICQDFRPSCVLNTIGKIANYRYDWV